MLVFRIALPISADASAFVTLMRDEYFPAVHRPATQIGQVTDMTLL